MTTQDCNTALIRIALNKAFDDAGLSHFCFDYFINVYKRFSSITKDRKIQLLLDHCDRNPNGFQKLLDAVKDEYKMSNSSRDELLPLIDALKEYLKPLSPLEPFVGPVIPPNDPNFINRNWEVLLLGTLLVLVVIIAIVSNDMGRSIEWQPTEGVAIEPAATTIVPSLTVTPTISPTATTGVPSLTVTFTTSLTATTIVPSSTATPTTSPTATTIPPTQMYLEPVPDSSWGNGAINDIAYSKDEGLLAVASPLGIYLYEYLDGEWGQTEIFSRTNSVMVSVVFSKDGETLVSGDEDGIVWIWNIDLKNKELIGNHQSAISSLVFNEKEQILVSGSRDGQIQSWKLNENNKLCFVSDEIEGSIGHIAISPIGRTLASVSQNKVIRLWNLDQNNICSSPKTSDPLGDEEYHHEDPIDSIAFSSDEEYLVSGDSDGHLIVWRVSDGKALYQEKRTDSEEDTHNAGIRSLAFVHQEGNKYWLASGSYDKRILIREVEVEEGDEPKVGKPLQFTHRDSVESIVLTSDGQKLISRTRDNRVWLWQANDPKIQPKILEQHNDSVRRIVFSPDGERVAIAYRDDTVRLREVDNSKEPVVFKAENIFWTNDVVFADDQTIVSVGAELTEHQKEYKKVRCIDRTIWQWQWQESNTESPKLTSAKEQEGEEECSNEEENRGTITDTIATVALGPNGLLATGSLDNKVRLWEQTNGGTQPYNHLYTSQDEHKNSVLRVAFSRDGNWLASADADGGVQLWQVSGNRLSPVRPLDHPEAVKVTSIAFSPDNQWLVSGSSDGILRLWEVSSDETTPSAEWGRGEGAGSIFSLAFSSNEQQQMLASGSSDGIIRLWHVSDQNLSPTPMYAVRGHQGSAILSIAFEPNGKTLVSGARNGTVQRWKLSEGEREWADIDEGNKVVRVGTTISQRGRLAREAQDVLQGYELWEDEVNDLDNPEITIKIGDREGVELIHYNDDSDPDIAAKLTHILIIEDEVQFMLGPYSSTLTKSASAISEKYNVIMVQGTATSDQLFERGFKNFFGVSTPASKYMKKPLEDLALRGAKTVAIIYKEGDPFSESMVEGVKGKEGEGEGEEGERGWAIDNNLTVVELLTDTYSTANEDGIDGQIDEILKQFKEPEILIQLDNEGKLDIFMVIGHDKDGQSFFEHMPEDFQPKAIVIPVGPSNPQFVKDVELKGGDPRYIISPTQWEALQSECNEGRTDYEGKYFGTECEYAGLYQTKWNEQPTYQAAEATAAVVALTAAINKANLPTDVGQKELTNKVQEQLKILSINTFFGPITFDDESVNSEREMGVIQIGEDCKKVLINSSSDLIYPISLQTPSEKCQK